MKEVHLLNYNLIASLDDPDENLVSILLVFAEINHDHVDIVRDEVIVPFDNRLREGYQAYLNPTQLSFLIEFEEVEDFIAELKTQFTINGCKDADLIVK